MGRRTNHLRAARVFESPAVASHLKARPRLRLRYGLRQRFRFRTDNVKCLRRRVALI
jgi:hypothetical protein